MFILNFEDDFDLGDIGDHSVSVEAAIDYDENNPYRCSARIIKAVAIIELQELCITNSLKKVQRERLENQAIRHWIKYNEEKENG